MRKLWKRSKYDPESVTVNVLLLDKILGWSLGFILGSGVFLLFSDAAADNPDNRGWILLVGLILWMVFIVQSPKWFDKILECIGDIANKRDERLRRERVIAGLETPYRAEPPRHARLRDGVNARLLLEDVQVLIDRGAQLSTDLRNVNRAGDIRVWLTDISMLLADIVAPHDREDRSHTQLDFRYMVKDLSSEHMRAAPPPVVQAHVNLVIDYLREVEGRMPDYVESSGRGPQESSVSVNINGGTVVNPQIASQIANIDSSISGVVNQGNSELAEALKAIERAVLTDPHFDSDTRSDLLDNLSYLSDAAQSPPENRRKGLLKSALAALSGAAATGTELQSAIEAWGCVLNGLVGS